MFAAFLGSQALAFSKISIIVSLFDTLDRKARSVFKRPWQNCEAKSVSVSSFDVSWYIASLLYSTICKGNEKSVVCM
jgi:hypothetical protein